MKYQGTPTAFGAQQTDFASLFAGTWTGEHSGTVGRSNLLNGGSVTNFTNTGIIILLLV